MADDFDKSAPGVFIRAFTWLVDKFDNAFRCVGWCLVVPLPKLGVEFSNETLPPMGGFMDDFNPLLFAVLVDILKSFSSWMILKGVVEG